MIFCRVRLLSRRIFYCSIVLTTKNASGIPANDFWFSGNFGSTIFSISELIIVIKAEFQTDYVDRASINIFF